MFSNEQNHVVRALTIAGSDSGGGAGIQADLKTMHQFGIYGMSALTAVTAQNTVGVQGVFTVDPEFVASQLHSVLTDLGVDALKTGMLASEAIIDAVVNTLEDYEIQNLVVDPVMIAKGGESLLTNSAVLTLQSRLLPMAHVVTPNLPEASVLCGFEVATWEDCHRAAHRLVAGGSRTVVIKGGHMREDCAPQAGWFRHVKQRVAIDVVLHEGEFTYFVTPRVSTHKTHGTGCTFSAALTSMLARGASGLDAIATAKMFVFQAIENAKNWDVGSGHGPTDHSALVTLCTGFEPGGVYFLEGRQWKRIDE